MGLKKLPAGAYDLIWFDTVDGREIAQTVTVAKTGDVAWPKPDDLGAEIALSIVRRASASQKPTARLP